MPESSSASLSADAGDDLTPAISQATLRAAEPRPGESPSETSPQTERVGSPALSFAERRRIAHNCFACGRDNESGMHLDIRVNEDGRAVVDFEPPQIYQGFPGHMHGGLLATVLDEVMAWAIYAAGSWAVTAKIEIRYRQPVALDQPLRGIGEVTRDRGGRTFEAAGRIEDADGNIVAEASGIFMRVPVERMRSLAGFAETYAGDPRD